MRRVLLLLVALIMFVGAGSSVVYDFESGSLPAWSNDSGNQDNYFTLEESGPVLGDFSAQFLTTESRVNVVNTTSWGAGQGNISLSFVIQNKDKGEVSDTSTDFKIYSEDNNKIGEIKIIPNLPNAPSDSSRIKFVGGNTSTIATPYNTGKIYNITLEHNFTSNNVRVYDSSGKLAINDFANDVSNHSYMSITQGEPLFVARTQRVLLDNLIVNGRGTADDPYQIYTCGQLQDIEDDLDGYYQLQQDIDCSGSEQSPIEGGFKGVFDGDGHTISNWTYRPGGTKIETGLFATTDSGADLKNFSFVNASLEGLVGETGLIVGKAQGTTLSNVYVNGLLDGIVDIGGVAGYYDNGEMNNVFADVTVDTTDRFADFFVAGVIARSDGSTLENVTVTSDFIGTPQDSAAEYPALFDGGSTTNDVFYLSNSGWIDAGNKGTALSPYQLRNAQVIAPFVTNSERWSPANPSEDGPDFARYPVLTDLSLKEQYRATDVGEGTTTDPYRIASCRGLQNIDDYLSKDFVLTGDIPCGESSNYDNENGFTPIGIENSFSGSIDGKGYSVNNLYINRSGQSGGLIQTVGSEGVVKNFKLKDFNYHRLGNPSGGFAAVNKGTLSNLAATGNIDYTASSGGLVGVQKGGFINSSYAGVSILGGDNLGGLVGNLSDGSLQNSFSYGLIQGAANIGGAVGTANLQQASASDIYYDYENSGLLDSAVGISLTTLESQGKAPFCDGNMGGLDFQNTWFTQANDYPELRNFALNPLNLNCAPNIVSNTPVDGATVTETPVTVETTINDKNGDDVEVKLRRNGNIVDTASITNGFGTVELDFGSVNPATQYNYNLTTSDDSFNTVGSFIDPSFTTAADLTPPELNVSDNSLSGEINPDTALDIRVNASDPNSGLSKAVLSTNESGEFRRYGGKEISSVASSSFRSAFDSVTDVTFADNGSYYYFLQERDVSGNLTQTQCSDPYNVSTCSIISSKNITFNPDSTLDFRKGVDGIEVKPDGSKVFIGTRNFTIREYTCSNVDDVSSCSEVNRISKERRFGESGRARNLDFREGGEKLVDGPDGAGRIRVLECSVPYSLESCSTVSRVNVENVIGDFVSDMAFRYNGSDKYVATGAYQELYRYSCSSETFTRFRDCTKEQPLSFPNIGGLGDVGDVNFATENLLIVNGGFRIYNMSGVRHGSPVSLSNNEDNASFTWHNEANISDGLSYRAIVDNTFGGENVSQFERLMEAPEIDNVSLDTTPPIFDEALISADAQDKTSGLSQIYFSSNETGSFVDRTGINAYNFSSPDLTESDLSLPGTDSNTRYSSVVWGNDSHNLYIQTAFPWEIQEYKCSTPGELSSCTFEAKNDPEDITDNFWTWAGNGKYMYTKGFYDYGATCSERWNIETCEKTYQSSGEGDKGYFVEFVKPDTVWRGSEDIGPSDQSGIIEYTCSEDSNISTCSRSGTELVFNNLEGPNFDGGDIFVEYGREGRNIFLGLDNTQAPRLYRFKCSQPYSLGTCKYEDSIFDYQKGSLHADFIFAYEPRSNTFTVANNQQGLAYYEGVYGSPDVFSSNPTSASTSFLWSEDKFRGEVGYRVFAEDKAGNVGSSSLKSFFSNIQYDDDGNEDVTVTETQFDNGSIDDKGRDDVSVTDKSSNNVSIDSENIRDISVGSAVSDILDAGFNFVRSVGLDDSSDNVVSISKSEDDHVSVTDESSNNVSIISDSIRSISLDSGVSSGLNIGSNFVRSVTVGQIQADNVDLFRSGSNNLGLSSATNRNITIPFSSEPVISAPSGAFESFLPSVSIFQPFALDSKGESAPLPKVESVKVRSLNSSSSERIPSGETVQIRANVTHVNGRDNLEYANVSLESPDESLVVDGASMDKIGEIPEGNEYAFNYNLPENQESSGDWDVEVKAEDALGDISSGLTSFIHQYIETSRSVVSQRETSVFENVPQTEELTLTNPSGVRFDDLRLNVSIPNDVVADSVEVQDPNGLTVQVTEFNQKDFVLFSVDSVGAGDSDNYRLTYSINSPSISNNNFTSSQDGRRVSNLEYNISPAGESVLKDSSFSTGLSSPSEITSATLLKNGTDISLSPDVGFEFVDSNGDGLEDRVRFNIPSLDDKAKYTVKVSRGQPLDIEQDTIVTNLPVTQSKTISWRRGISVSNDNDFAVDISRKVRLPLRATSIRVDGEFETKVFDDSGAFVPVEFTVGSDSQQAVYVRYETPSIDISRQRFSPDRFYMEKSNYQEVNVTFENPYPDEIKEASTSVDVIQGNDLVARSNGDVVDRRESVETSYDLDVENISGEDVKEVNVRYEVPVANASFVGSQNISNGNVLDVFKVDSNTPVSRQNVRFEIDNGNFSCIQAQRVYTIGENRTLDYRCGSESAGAEKDFSTVVEFPTLQSNQELRIGVEHRPYNPVVDNARKAAAVVANNAAASGVVLLILTLGAYVSSKGLNKRKINRILNKLG
jgi:hypothetical protein